MPPSSSVPLRGRKCIQYVDIDGDHVLGLWGGYRDEARTAPWDEHTITNVWSSTKTVTSLAALMLVDRGELDVDQPVAKYWPEFGAHGKQDVLVRHVMSHASGVSGLDQPASVEVLYDWEQSTSRMAAQAPWWSRAPHRVTTRSTTGTSRFGIGYGLPLAAAVAYIPDEKICFWGGWGGSIIIMDTGRRMTVSYMMNKMGPGVVGSDRSAEYVTAIYDAVAP